ncbi:MAG: inositol monophosphatase [Acidobacteria bacterium]|nr:inositol monophosphatase [Acidobacteriota bacterium]
MSVELSRRLEVAVQAVRRGGEVSRARMGDPGYVSWKGDRDLVAQASLDVQEAIASTILAAYPRAGILAEEGPAEATLPVDADQLWIVDPICGSLNFVQGIPHFGLSVALRSAGRIQVGVVYDPSRDELFAATADTPATLNGRNIGVQQISEGSEAWSGAILGTDWPCGGDRRRKARSIVNVMVDQVLACTMMGSPALGFCHVAAGRLHAYWHLDLKIWDIAAASLIVERAGGVLTDARGMTWLYSDGDYVASNGVIHNSLLNCLQPML